MLEIDHMTNRTCSVPECAKQHAARGYCKTHYYAKRASGELVIPGTRPCSVDGCDKPVESRELCRTHAERFRRYGTTEPPAKPEPRPTYCTVEGCEKVNKGHGMCQMHYARWKKHGTTALPQRATKRCSVEGCDRKYRCSGYCGMHYSRFINKGEPGPLEMLQSVQGLTCKVEDCERRASHYGQCQFHYGRQKILEEVATNPSRRINSWATTDERLRRVGWTERVVRPDLGPCWEWNGGKDRRGYGRIALKGRVMRAAHRVSFEEWVRPLASDEVACHKCDNPPCMNPAHLFAGTHEDNMRDAANKDRTMFGEKSPHHKLTEAQVVEIRERYSSTLVTYGDLATEYGVCRASIVNIVKGKTWARAGGPLATADGRRGGATRRWAKVAAERGEAA